MTRRLIALALAFLFGLAGPAGAATSEAITNDHVTVRLISSVEAVGDESEIPLGLHFQLKPGWKVYWRSAGDAGYPPTITWLGSDNLAGTEWQWPLPERFSVLGFESLGYKKEVVYPITAKLEQPGQPLAARARVDFLTCSEICVPYQLDLSLDIPAGPASAAPEGHLLGRFLAQVPGDGAATGIVLQTVGIEDTAGGRVLRASATSTLPFVAPDLYVEGTEEGAFAKPAVYLSPDRLQAVLAVPLDKAPGGIRTQDGVTVTLTLADQGRGAEAPLTLGPVPTIPADFTKVSAAVQAPLGMAAAPSRLLILGLALLGGLILNLMPCVLPVLSIKLLGVVRHGGGDAGEVRRSFVATSAGIVATFVGLAAVLAGLKAAGAAIGWGIQFQQPWFLIAMTLMVTLFAANLWGLFEVRLPGFVAAGAEKSPAHGGTLGHFLSGVFATLLATPCSAPFLGTAVGFALAGTTVDIIAIFFALGLGMSSPYLLVALMPRLATALPKPGLWMVRLRQVLGLALAATAAWLVSVLWGVVGGTAASAIGFLMIGVVLLLAIGRSLRVRTAATGVLVLAVLAFAAPGLAPASPTVNQQTEKLADDIWQRFEEAPIPTLVGSGKVVFVDVTADWCITCQVNKAAVFANDEAVALLSAETTVLMKADWTKPDPVIAEFLARHGRYGIPFNVVYGPAVPNGIILPELLTPGRVVEAINQAAGS